MTRKTLRRLLIFWAYFIGLGALLGSMMMFLEPKGMFTNMDVMLPLLRDKLPWFEPLFDNFIASGVVLLLVCGITNYISAALLHLHSRYDWLGGFVCGVILMLWTGLEFYIWGFVFASVLYFIFGLLQAITAILFYTKKKTDKSK